MFITNVPLINIRNIVDLTWLKKLVKYTFNTPANILQKLDRLHTLIYVWLDVSAPSAVRTLTPFCSSYRARSRIRITCIIPSWLNLRFNHEIIINLVRLKHKLQLMYKSYLLLITRLRTFFLLLKLHPLLISFFTLLSILFFIIK